MNGTASEQDVIIIGSGPAGTSVAAPLVAAGMRVLMLDGAGDEAERSARDMLLGPDLESLRREDGLSPKLRTPAARRLMEPFASDSGIAADNFVPVGAIGRGGLSRIWGACVAEFDEADISRWPIAYAELQRSYRNVVQRIGVSGSAVEAVPQMPNAADLLQPPLPLSDAARALLARRPSSSDAGFKLGLASNAVLTEDRAGRRACDNRGECLFGCPIGAIYDAAYDARDLRAHRNFRLVDGARVVALSRGGDQWSVRTADGRSFAAPTVCLAAGTLASTRLALHLLKSVPPAWRVLTSPVLAVPLLQPRRIASRHATGHTLAQLGYVLRYGSRPLDYVSGAVYDVAGLPASSFVNRMPLGRRAGRRIFDLLASSLMVATSYFSGDFSNNRIEVTPDGILVKGGFADGFDDVRKTVLRDLNSNWRRLGLLPLPLASLAKPGTDAHLAGTLPMGSQAGNGTDAFGELAGNAGLHVVDGSILPSLPSKHTTLTIMANADRIGRHLVERGKA